jgi:ribosome-binding ATPase YchF (GTP1/OBG family)
MGTILPLSIKSMHIFGSRDRLVPVESSKALLPSYLDPVVHEHDGGHHIPMRAADVREILKFIDLASSASSNIKHIETYNKILNLETVTNVSATPDEEHAQLQIDECESMSLIFPEEFQLLSMVEDGTQNIVPGETNYKYPITYVIQLKPSPEQLEEEDDLKELWPKNDIALKVEYTAEYPDSLPIFSLQHDMNLLEFKISQETACLDTVKEAAITETGMPCVMSCVYAAREFFEGGGLLSSSVVVASDNNDECEHGDKDTDDATAGQLEDHSLLRPSSVERIEKCKLEGLQISYNVAGYNSASILTSSSGNVETDDNKNETISGKGGSWKYTIGLVGKPSAGKSTFFNAATAFARQRGGDNADQDGIAIGGATMAPHPFTTIDPNVGYCLVPAPAGSCPEDDSVQDTIISCSHGRDSYGRRLLPVMLKDVAGLVPGAYQGRGRGNKFLDDLLDADVLIHVLDSSGTADTEGNKVVAEGDTSDDTSGSNPLNDIAWVHNELIEWIVSNLLRRWDTISRRGRHKVSHGAAKSLLCQDVLSFPNLNKNVVKLVNMFSGYKQSQAFVWDVLLSVERFLLNHEGRDHALDHLSSWDKGDLYRLVTAFLGVRFPTALALNKNDLPSSKLHCDNISQALPLHGAHIGIPMSADREMRFVRHHIYSAIAPEKRKKDEITENSPPKEVWNCLQSAIKLREPVLVFPVFDMENYQPLPGMFNFATRDASLPSLGMISCLEAAGGHAPSMWDTENNAYYSSPGDIESGQILRDCLIMKPNSTVEDVFDYLKRLGALGGEFVRAEAIGNVGEKPKLVKKDELVGKHNRILKIMTTKRREWQKAMSLIH